MKYFDWDALKNSKLKADRDVCFEDVLFAIDDGRLLNDIDHPNQILLDLRRTSFSPELSRIDSEAFLSDGEVAVATSTSDKEVLDDSGSSVEAGILRKSSLYPDQKVFVLVIDDYIYLVPYIEDGTKIFFETIYPSRKMTKKYYAERKKL